MLVADGRLEPPAEGLRYIAAATPLTLDSTVSVKRLCTIAQRNTDGVFASGSKLTGIHWGAANEPGTGKVRLSDYSSVLWQGGSTPTIGPHNTIQRNYSEGVATISSTVIPGRMWWHEQSIAITL